MPGSAPTTAIRQQDKGEAEFMAPPEGLVDDPEFPAIDATDPVVIRPTAIAINCHCDQLSLRGAKRRGNLEPVRH
jgi:hypothetical protein